MEFILPLVWGNNRSLKIKKGEKRGKKFMNKHCPNTETLSPVLPACLRVCMMRTNPSRPFNSLSLFAAYEGRNFHNFGSKTTSNETWLNVPIAQLKS